MIFDLFDIHGYLHVLKISDLSVDIAALCLKRMGSS